jgi:hypothetical protein
VFIAAIELLEAFEYHSKTFASSNWEWLFDTIVPWLAIAIVLTQAPHARQPSIIDRAQWQVNLNFQRFSDPSNAVSATPMWKLLVQLREHMQESRTSSPNNQSNTTPGSSHSLQTTAEMNFAGDLMLDSEIYTAGNEAFLYEDQFMQDLPW